MATIIFEMLEPARTSTDQDTRHPKLEVSNSQCEHSLSMNPNHCQREIHQEIHMYTKTDFFSVWPVLGAALVACTLFAGSVAAKDQEFTVAIHVSTQGLDLSQPAEAQKLYWRLLRAARVACTNGYRVGLAPSDDPQGCREKALGNAVRSANIPLVTQAYLATHTLREAAARGIDVPVQMAAK
jgi:UrcA family protein